MLIFIAAKLFNRPENIAFYKNRARFYLNRDFFLFHIDRSIKRVFVFVGQIPERIFYYSGSVFSDSKLQEKRPCVFVLFKKILIAFCRFVPVVVINKSFVAAEVHRQWFSADRAVRRKLGRNFHFQRIFRKNRLRAQANPRRLNLVFKQLRVAPSQSRDFSQAPRTSIFCCSCRTRVFRRIPL